MKERILHAAMAAFMRFGYAETSTLDIARRARVSKRDLYAHFSDKQAILAACIAHRARLMHPQREHQPIRSLAKLEVALIRFGTAFLREVLDPDVTSMYRLAIAESMRAPEVARTLDLAGQQPVQAAMRTILADARSSGFIADDDLDTMTRNYFALLWCDLQMPALLRLGPPPGQAELRARARGTAAAFLLLHSAGRGRQGGSGRRAAPSRPRGGQRAKFRRTVR